MLVEPRRGFVERVAWPPRSRSSIGVVHEVAAGQQQRRAGRGRPTRAPTARRGIDERKAESRVGWPIGPSQASNASKARAARREAMVHAAPAVGHSAATQRRQGVAEQLRRRLALAARAAPSSRAARPHRLARAARGTPGWPRDAAVAASSRSASGAKSRVTRREHAEDRLARPERRIAVDEMRRCRARRAAISRIRVGEREIHVVREVGRRARSGRGCAAASIARAASASRRLRRGEALGRPVRQPVVVLVHAGERGRHRPAPIVTARRTGRAPRQAAGRHSSGSVTHRRSRNDCSTALIVSCTHAPSSKLPSLASSSDRISPMKLLMRLA